MNNPLKQIPEMGQSIWLDYIRRGFLLNGDLKALIDNDALRGVTSNPAIFEEAIAHSDDYKETIMQLARTSLTNKQIFLNLAIEDVRTAADIFKGVYDATAGLDGYVSLEVSPDIALDTTATISEALSLWKELDRPNVMIKIPATFEGLAAIKKSISEGLNVNVTLLFGLQRYREVAEAYIEGLEERVKAGKPVDHIYSVASFFLSRIDTMVDPMLEKIITQGGQQADLAKTLLGKAAIASAKMAYQIYKELFFSERFNALREKGANPQRLLWASTGTKNKAYSDVKYIEALIGPDTVNTVPQDTLKAYRDHGKPAIRIEQDIADAASAMKDLEKVGLSIDSITKTLVDEGIEKFVKPFQSLMNVLAGKRKEATDLAH